MPQTVEFNRQYAYERSLRNRYFEERTDIAERLGYPIDTVIGYSLKNGALHAVTDTVDRPFYEVTRKAKDDSWRFQGDQAFERLRLTHEYEESLDADRLARGELDGNVMVAFSKVPDAVAENRTSINGYRRDLLRSFVRIYWRTSDGVKCRLFTLDHNHREGMKDVGLLLGIDMSQDSESILADRQVVTVPEDTEVFASELANRVKQVYDQAIYDASGQRTNAGSHYVDQTDALAAVYEQPSLFEEHMRAIRQLDDREALEVQRERIAAAIKLAHEGSEVHSVSDASVSAEVASGNYGGECATASSAAANGMNQARTMEQVWTHGECLVCFATTMVGSCMVCARCAAADDRGEDLLKLRERNMRKRERNRYLAAQSLQAIERTDRSTNHGAKSDMIAKRYGKHARVITRNIIGGAKREVIVDGDVVATI